MTDFETPRLSARDMARMQQTMKRGASRRDVMKMLVASGMTIAAAGYTATRATTALASTPVRGGDLRVAGSSASTAEGLDPSKFRNGTDYSRGFMIYNGLTFLDGDLTPQPELATDWSSSNGTDWTFNLRSGVTFHDGRPFTSEDVVFSILRHKDPETASRARSYVASIQDVVADGEHTVKITLSEPNYDLPVILGTFNLLITPAGTTDFNAGIGTGPYKLEAFEPGVRSVVARNEEYWKDGKQHVDTVEYFGLTDESSRLNALRAGEFHLTTGINPRSTPLIQREENIELFVTQSGTFSDVAMQKTDSTVGSDDFALGIKHLLQRETIQGSIYRDFASIANDQPIAPTMKYHDPSIEQREYDPEKAKFHLERAGVMGQTVPLVASAGIANTLDIALILQQAGQEIGFDIDVQRVPVDGYWSNVWMKVPFGFGTITQRPAADMIFSLCYASDGAYNSSKWENAQFDQMLLQARVETDEDKRAALYSDMQQLVRDEAGTGIPVFFSNIDAHATSLKGLQPIPTGNMMGYAFAENVWIEE
ncbi:ABC transporter substrate-binding protein [Pseudooceanicola marinus]|uniref:ABC transporter substrate-binding protein n=1 Tax=Pseudooceanicola marinus TaxID=396013 RepID=UPI001CD34BE1|nr:ABC transporter substrate-binding protein [Pseudooceanicola marinus]MCA1338283.1 ABC transporter substrate-binding protein [Pseudooceanicola marinus]